jgi:hypothetical protein
MNTPNDFCDLVPDVGPLESVLDRLRSAAETDGAIQERLIDLVNSPTQLVRAECETAMGAVKVTFFPTDALLELLPASLADDLRGH